ncbi:MAG TPA: hypothetical protein VFJ61_06565 [Solirubrobacterales bacterium]|nr:hypothetical protein [Solirubrobacterales bacterium]
MSVLEKFQFHLYTAAEKVKVNPDPGGLPGTDAFQKLLNGGAALALLAAAGAFLIGAGQYGIGSRSHNYSQATDGRERMLKSLAGAFAIGAVAAVVNFFYTAGTGVH